MIQPGGSVRDAEVIEAANERNMTMILPVVDISSINLDHGFDGFNSPVLHLILKLQYTLTIACVLKNRWLWMSAYLSPLLSRKSRRIFKYRTLYFSMGRIQSYDALKSVFSQNQVTHCPKTDWWRARSA